jgi:hypothetical protein
MAVANLTNDSVSLSVGNDSIVIRDNFEAIRGGRTLDVTGYTPEVINAGHVIIKSSAGEYKPMPVNAGATAYAALPADHTYAGILVSSVLTSRPFAGIMVRGSVNPAAAPFPMATIQSAVSAALPLITFLAD